MTHIRARIGHNGLVLSVGALDAESYYRWKYKARSVRSHYKSFILDDTSVRTYAIPHVRVVIVTKDVCHTVIAAAFVRVVIPVVKIMNLFSAFR